MNRSPRPLRIALLAASAGTMLAVVACQQQTTLVPVRPSPVAPSGAMGSEPLRLGTVDFPTSGSPAAQSHFLYGVAALHSFWYEEALEAFARAAKVEPNFSMAYWGEAMCYHRSYRPGSDYNAGRRALAKIKDVKQLRSEERRVGKEGRSRVSTY